MFGESAQSQGNTQRDGKHGCSFAHVRRSTGFDRNGSSNAMWCWCVLGLQVWDVSGGLSASSGAFLASSPRRWATPAASHRTPITTRSAQVPSFVHMHAFSTWVFFEVMVCAHPGGGGGSALPGCASSVRSVRVQGVKKCNKNDCFKYGALILSLPSLHLQSTTQNALLQMGYTPLPLSPPPHDLLVRIGLCTLLYCRVFFFAPPPRSSAEVNVYKEP